jgi:UDP-glucuronate 4-epimerase
VYGNNVKAPFSEEDRTDEPISPYAATKRAGELLCHASAHLSPMAVACLRFFTVYGPAQRPDLAIARFMGLIAGGEEVPFFGDGSTSRDYTYVDDIIGGVIAAEEAIGAGDVGRFRIWNLGGASPVTLEAMVDTIARTVGRPARIRRLPMQPGDVERTWADLSRSGRELGYRPVTPFEEGVRRQWEWMRSRASAAVRS